MTFTREQAKTLVDLIDNDAIFDIYRYAKRRVNRIDIKCYLETNEIDYADYELDELVDMSVELSEEEFWGGEFANGEVQEFCDKREYRVYWIDEDGEKHSSKRNSLRKCLYSASYQQCFSDCDGTREVWVGNEFDSEEKYHYTGWLPDLRFVWKDSEGNIVFDECFPNWEH